MFSLLRSENQEKPLDPNDKIDKSTLYALLIHLQVDKKEEEFFLYLRKCLESNSSPTISKAEFDSMFFDPKIDIKTMNAEEMT